MREISLRHLRHAPLRTGLVVFGIALGVCLLSAVLAVNQSLLGAFEEMVERVAGHADLTVAGGEAGIPVSLTAEIASLDGVAHAAPMLEIATRTPDGRGGALLVLGVDFLGDPFFLPFHQAGQRGVVDDPLAFVNDPTAILVSRRLARERNLQVGSPLPLVTSEGDKVFHVRGLLDDDGPAASFGGHVVVMFLDAAQVSFARGYAVDRINVAIAAGCSLSDVRARIATFLDGRAQVEEPKGQNQRLFGSLWAFRNGLQVSGLVALLVGMFLIYNAVSVSVAQRRREVGVLRALGVTRAGVVRLFCVEALLMGLLGSAVGLCAARELAVLALANVQGTVHQFMLPVRPRLPEISLHIAATSVLAGLLTTLAAAYVPALQTSRVDPAEALRATRSTALWRRLPSRHLALAGALLSGLAAVPALLGGELNGYLATLTLVLGLSLFVPMIVRILHFSLVPVADRLWGIVARLALDNVERSLGRSAVTVIALMLAVSMSMTVGTYASAFRRSLQQWATDAFPADAVITSGSPIVDRQHVSFAPSMLERLARVSGLAAINPVRTMLQDVLGRRIEVSAMDTASYFQACRQRGKGRRVVKGPVQLESRALTEAPRVLISENFADRTGLTVGDSLELLTPSGQKTFEVYAVVVDYSSDQGWLLMDRSWYHAFFHDGQVDSLELYFAPGADAERVVAEVHARLGGSEALFVTLQANLRGQIEAAGDSIFAMAKAPEFITLLVAMMGVIGTMLAAVIDRVCEVGLLRAVGATRRQILHSIVAEAVFLGVAAVVCGVLAGIPLGYVFLKVIGTATSGWNLPYGFPADTALRMGLSVLSAATLAGWLPGMRAASLDVKDALAYE